MLWRIGLDLLRLDSTKALCKSAREYLDGIGHRLRRDMAVTPEAMTYEFAFWR